MCFANIFSQSGASVSIFLIASTEQKFLISIKVNINIFFHRSCILELCVRSHHQTKCHMDFLLFPSRSFIILLLCLWSFLRNFVVVVVLIVVCLWELCGLCLGSFFGIQASNFSSSLCWKDYVCSIKLPLYLCKRSVDSYMYVKSSSVLCLLS